MDTNSARGFPVINPRRATTEAVTLAFTAPGHYRIEIQGYLPPSWYERLGAMQLLYPASEANGGITLLQIRVADQAELSGILNTLYELHLPLISLNCLGAEPSSADEHR